MFTLSSGALANSHDCIEDEEIALRERESEAVEDAEETTAKVSQPSMSGLANCSS